DQAAQLVVVLEADVARQALAAVLDGEYPGRAVADDLLHPGVIHERLQDAEPQQAVEDALLDAVLVDEARGVGADRPPLKGFHALVDERPHVPLVLGSGRQQVALAEQLVQLCPHLFAQLPLGRPIGRAGQARAGGRRRHATPPGPVSGGRCGAATAAAVAGPGTRRGASASVAGASADRAAGPGRRRAAGRPARATLSQPDLWATRPSAAGRRWPARRAGGRRARRRPEGRPDPTRSRPARDDVAGRSG